MMLDECWCCGANIRPDGSPPPLTEERMFRIGLYNLATDLVMQASGAMDPAPDEDVIATVRYLRKRLREWRPSVGRSEARDDAMRAYVRAALSEWVAHLVATARALSDHDRVTPEPRYDEVFAEGTAWLDSLAKGEP